MGEDIKRIDMAIRSALSEHYERNAKIKSAQCEVGALGLPVEKGELIVPAENQRRTVITVTASYETIEKDITKIKSRLREHLTKLNKGGGFELICSSYRKGGLDV